MDDNMKKKALKAYDEFVAHYSTKYLGAWKCLEKDKGQMFNFYAFPAEHWEHIRTTNPIESTFAIVRHRSRQTKGCGSRMTTLTMVYKLGTMAQSGWRRLKGGENALKIVAGVKFKDGEEVLKEQIT